MFVGWLSRKREIFLGYGHMFAEGFVLDPSDDVIFWQGEPSDSSMKQCAMPSLPAARLLTALGFKLLDFGF